MEFWGVEIKNGQLVDVKVVEGSYLLLTQASLRLGQTDKTQERVILYIHVNGKKIVFATLDPELLPTQICDLAFYTDFQISHNLKNGSVYIFGYKTKQLISFSKSDADCHDDKEEETPKKEENSKVEEARADLRIEQYALKPKTLDDVFEATHTSPTTKECMGIVTCFPGYEEGSLGCLQALRVFAKSMFKHWDTFLSNE